MIKNYKKIYVCIFSLALVLSVSSCSFFKGDSVYKRRGTCRGDCSTHRMHHQKDCLKQLCDVAQEGFENKHGFAPSGGMQFKPLFNGYVTNEAERFERLEDAVQQLRNEVDVMAPKVIKTPVVEPLSAKVTYNIEPMSLKSPSTLNVVKPMRVEENKYVANSMPKAMSGESIKSIRMADHKDKTRVVLDVTSGTPLKTTIANNGKTLIVDLDGVAWKTKTKWLATRGALISGYRVEGNKLYVDLMYSSKITTSSMLKPARSITSFYRLVIDLVSSEIHKM